jgi:hypothetical protein
MTLLFCPSCGKKLVTKIDHDFNTNQFCPKDNAPHFEIRGDYSWEFNEHSCYFQYDIVRGILDVNHHPGLQSSSEYIDFDGPEEFVKYCKLYLASRIFI